MLFLIKSILLSFILSISVLYPGSANRQSYAKTDENYNKSEINNYWLALQISTFLYLEYGIDHHVDVDEKSAPNQVDQYFRNQIKWSTGKMDHAASISDLLLYGAFIGTIPLVPAFSNNYYSKALKMSLNVISLNGIITNIVKMTVKRQRPDSFYKTRTDADDSFRSFFSGHTSTTFALGTSNAILLSEAYPDKKNLIWFANLSLATATGYLRIAGDKHYSSDVFCGGIVGYFVAKYSHKKMDAGGTRLGFSFYEEHPAINFSFRL